MGYRNRLVDGYRAVKAPARRHVARNWNRRPYRDLARLSASYTRVVNNRNNDITENGETVVMDRLHLGPGATVVDVGAHVGDWTAALLERWPDVHVVCLEPLPGSAAALAARFASQPGVTVHPLALSDGSGARTLHRDGTDDSLSTLLARRTGSTGSDLTVEVLTGDDLLARSDVDRIDYLKIDTEGHDLAVLAGFGETLARGAVAALQFEYNELAIAARSLLLDYYELLEPLGYTIGKLRPDGVAFKAYDPADENWIGPDCIAVHRSRPDLIARLGT